MPDLDLMLRLVVIAWLAIITGLVLWMRKGLARGKVAMNALPTQIEAAALRAHLDELLIGQAVVLRRLEAIERRLSSGAD